MFEVGPVTASRRQGEEVSLSEYIVSQTGNSWLPLPSLTIATIS